MSELDNKFKEFQKAYCDYINYYIEKNNPVSYEELCLETFRLIECCVQTTSKHLKIKRNSLIISYLNFVLNNDIEVEYETTN